MAQPQVGHLTTLIGTTVELLFEAPTTYGQINLYLLNEGGAKCYLGDNTITTSGATEGYSLNNGASLQMILNGGEQIYAISASSSKICLLWTL